MTKQINEYTVDELSAKIEAIIAERERTANALKRYEEELELRKQKVPLGVPQDGKFFVHADYCVGERFGLFSSDYMKYNCFSSKESAEKHAKMLLDWRKDGLLANSKGEPIDIKVLLPLLKKGYVAMDKDGHWFWYEEKQTFCENEGIWKGGEVYYGLFAFNLKPAEDWRESLMECGL